MSFDVATLEVLENSLIAMRLVVQTTLENRRFGKIDADREKQLDSLLRCTGLRLLDAAGCPVALPIVDMNDLKKGGMECLSSLGK